MCGIMAIMGGSEEVLQTGLELMQRRGPDAVGTIDLGFAILGIRRLAITDSRGGDQPLQNASGSIICVFNGALYNAQSLIEHFDIPINSGNDGEVIPFLYEKFGLGFVSQLEGMYAIIVADNDARTLTVAVDPLGIKPLYWAGTRDGMVIASTVEAMPRTCWPLAWRIPPGTVWRTDGQSAMPHRQVSPPSSDLSGMLFHSVRSHIPKEVPWGCLLSGGVDSSAITALAQRAYDQPLKTFTSGFADSEDRIAAARLAEHLGTEHHEEILTAEELPELLETVIHMTASPDPYIIMNGIGTYAAARAARKAGMKVVLSGEGADELYAGYEEYLENPPYVLNALLVHDQNDLAATECLRLDRCTMACSIEARVPFLTRELVSHARRLPSEQKISSSGGAVIRKAVLRDSVKDILPPWVAQREKTPFFRGTGVSAALNREAENRFSDSDVRHVAAHHPNFPIHTPLAAWVFSIWEPLYGGMMGKGWQHMVDRGLVRRRFSLYQPTIPGIE